MFTDCEFIFINILYSIMISLYLDCFINQSGCLVLACYLVFTSLTSWQANLLFHYTHITVSVWPCLRFIFQADHDNENTNPDWALFLKLGVVNTPRY